MGVAWTAQVGRYAWDLVRLLLIPFLLVYLCLVIYRLTAPAQWAFSIEAAAQVVELTLPVQGQARWRIDHAVLCTRDALDLESSIDAPPGACGSSAWHAHALADEAVLVLEAGVRAWVEVRPDGVLAASLRGTPQSTVGAVSLMGAPDVLLPDRVNLVWPKATGALMFPFTAAITIGRDVTWSDSRVLKGGKIDVYTADESASRRRHVAGTSLLLGDQVRIGDSGRAGSRPPKGFIRYDSGSVLDVVAFGEAESIVIERFGDSGYDFRPGRFVRLINDSVLTFWGSLLGVYIAFIGSVKGMLLSSDEDPYVIVQTMKRLLSRLRTRSST